MEWKGNKAPKEMFALLAAQRTEKDSQPVGLPVIRKVLRSETHLRGRNATRGRKRCVTAHGVEALDNARTRAQEQAARHPYGATNVSYFSGARTVPVRYPHGTHTVPGMKTRITRTFSKEKTWKTAFAFFSIRKYG